MPYHHVVEIIPLQPGLCDHARGDQRRQRRPQTVQRMQHPHHLVRVLHISHKGIPRAVDESIAKSGDDKADDEKRVRRMAGRDDVADEVGRWSEDGDAAAAETLVDEVVDQGGQDVAEKRGQEHERHNGVRDGVVGF